jgi:hypothetical protein
LVLRDIFNFSGAPINFPIKNWYWIWYTRSCNLVLPPLHLSITLLFLLVVSIFASRIGVFMHFYQYKIPILDFPHLVGILNQRTSFSVIVSTAPLLHTNLNSHIKPPQLQP